MKWLAQNRPPPPASDRFCANSGTYFKGFECHNFGEEDNCLLIRRAVLDKVGSKLREWTDLSLFDTDILSAKAQQAGFKLARAGDVFVHHFGTRTFAQGSPVGRQMAEST